MGGGYVAKDVNEFCETVRQRLRSLAQESELPIVLPLGLFLVIDEANGDSETARELVKRIFLLDQESKNIIDFYYLGWSLKKSDPDPGSADRAQFSLKSFAEFRQTLSLAGIRDFGGNADLILVDAELGPSDFVLRFDQAIRVDLAAGIKSGRLPPLGGFIQTLVRVAEEVRASASTSSPVWRISDRLRLVYARQSILDTLFEKWGRWIGAGGLQAFAVRHLAPALGGLDLQARGHSGEVSIAVNRAIAFLETKNREQR
jgi:hypothetical protein